MRIYRVTISADKYPTEYTVQASGWGTAAARAVREWQRGKGKGARTEEVKVRIIKGGQLLKEKEN